MIKPMTKLKAKYKANITDLNVKATTLLNKVSKLQISLFQAELFDNPKRCTDKNLIERKTDTLRLQIINTTIHYNNGIIKSNLFSNSLIEFQNRYFELTESNANWFSHTSHSTTR